MITIINYHYYRGKNCPKHYSDLLNGEKIYREILTWVKSWDDIVFNRKFTIPKVSIPNMNNSLSPIKPNLIKSV